MKSQTAYKIERHATLVQLNDLEKEWSDLLDEIPNAPIFLTWEWISTWWRFFGQDHQLWLLTARDKQGRLVGIAPLMREEYKKGFMKLGMIAFIGTGRVCPTNMDILTRTTDKEGLYRAFLGFLWSQSDQWDVLRIASVVRDSTENKLLMAAGGCIRIGAETTYLAIHLPDNWETYVKTFSRNFRRDTKSSRGKLERDYPGMVNFAFVTDSRKLNTAMEKLEELVRSRCRAKGLFTDWDDPNFASFQRTIAALALNRGWLHLCTLTVEDRVIAIVHNFRYKDSVFGYNLGFDSDWSKYNPGRVLIVYSIQAAIQEAVSQYELGRGNAEHKFTWANHERVENEILFSSNWKGDLWIKLGNFERGLKIKGRQLLDRLALIRAKQLLSAGDKNKQKGNKEIVISRS